MIAVQQSYSFSLTVWSEPLREICQLLPQQHGLLLQHHVQQSHLSLHQHHRSQLSLLLPTHRWLYLCRGNLSGWLWEVCPTYGLSLLWQRFSGASWTGRQQGGGHVVWKSYIACIVYYVIACDVYGIQLGVHYTSNLSLKDPIPKGFEH